MSVKIETNDYNLLEHISSFLNKFYTSKQASFAKVGEADVKLFASKVNNQGIYFLHTNQFIHLYHYLKELGVELKPDEKIDNRDYKVEMADFKVRSHWVLRDYQQPIVDFLLENPTKSKLVPINMGQGKAQPLDSRIKCPNGWIFMRDIKVGDIVTAKDGTPTKVTGVFPQGVKPVYRLTFKDGRTCEASDEHLWKVFIIDEKKEHRKYQVINTIRLLELTERNKLVTYIDVIDKDNDKDIDLPIPPYLLGGLLGDGGFTLGSIKITKTDKEFIDKIRDLLPDTMEMVTQDNIRWRIVNKIKGLNKSWLMAELDKLGLRNKYSHEKFIPDIYLLSSYQQRLELLQGLLDTDGHVTEDGSIVYGTSSYLLMKNTEYLIRSLGGSATTFQHVPYYTYKGEKLKGKLAYKIGIVHKTPKDLFTLTRKRDRLNVLSDRHKNLRLLVKKVEYIGDKETQCISIEHPEHLYITDNFVVTHNTTIALHAIANINQKLGIVILPILVQKWCQDIVDVHEALTKDVMVIQGSKALRAIISMAKSDTADNNYYIFSSRTMQEYINVYEEDPELCLEMYGCAPIDLFPLLGIGVMLVDESHMHWHNIFKILIHTNVKYQIGLTATLLSDDPVVKRLYKIVYPDVCVYGDKLIQKYTDVYPVAYSIQPHLLKSIRTTNYGSNNYAHIAFEQSIMKNPDLYKAYIRLILTTIEDYFITDYKEGDKLLIYVATVKLATLLSDVLKEQYFKFIVNRYCEDDPYEFLMNSDIVVSSMIKSSTGVDIKGLRVVIQTISVSSQVSNIQSLGRLRKLSDRDTKFVYLYSPSIQKQKAYHIAKMELFKDRTASINLRQSRVGF